MDRDYLYFHFANLGLALIGILSIQKIVGPVIMALLLLGCAGGFLFSFYVRNSRPPHIDTFIGMLSLASVVVVLSRLYETDISFESLLSVFSAALAWLTLFQSFGLKAYRSYSLIQFISTALLISSVSLAAEQEISYVLYITIFLFILIFTMRLALVREKQSRGSLIIGDKDDVMSLWNQIKVGAIMFSIILILSAIVYPVVPRFNSLSMSWIPSTLLGLPEKLPISKLFNTADKTIKEGRSKKNQIVDDGTKKRESREDKIQRKGIDERKEETVTRFQSSDFKSDIDAFKIEALTIKSDRVETTIERQVSLSAEIRLTNDSVIPATRLVDWKAQGTAKVSIDKDGKMTAKEEGYVEISATYMGTFSNDLNIKIIAPNKPAKKKGPLFYFFVLLIWLIAGALLAFSVFISIRYKKLTDMRRDNPKEFIKEVYDSLCRGFRIYGMPRPGYMAYREFCNILIVEGRHACPLPVEPVKALTEGFMEARFSTHEISEEHIKNAIGLFREAKDIILQSEGRNLFWKNILFRLYVLDVTLIP